MSGIRKLIICKYIIAVNEISDQYVLKLNGWIRQYQPDGFLLQQTYNQCLLQDLASYTFRVH